VDPVKKSKTPPMGTTPRWRAAALDADEFSLTTRNIMPIKRLKLVEKDTRMWFEVEIRKKRGGAERTKKEKRPGRH